MDEVKSRMTLDDVLERAAYWKLEAEDEKAAHEKARAEAKSGR